MLSQINPRRIVIGHLRTLGSKRPSDPESISVSEGIKFFSLGLPFAVAQGYLITNGMLLQSELVGIIVSAASIIAGLLLNLLVLIFGLASEHQKNLNESRELFLKVIAHTFYNISFTVLSSLILVLTCLLCLANPYFLKVIGNILTFYIAPLVAFSLLMVLKKCHHLIDFYFKS